MRFASFWAAVSLILSAQFAIAQAGDNHSYQCTLRYLELLKKELQAEQRIALQALPGIETFELPEEYLRFLNQHPIAELHKKYGNGENLVFALEHFEKSGAIFLNHFGENIQANFLEKNLKALFPKATIDPEYPFDYSKSKKARWMKKHSGKKISIMGIRDSAEFADEFLLDHQVQMAVIKPANPGMAAVPHGKFRKPLGIPSDKYVVSLYMKDVDGYMDAVNAPSALGLIQEVEKVRVPDLVIISSGGKHLDYLLDTPRYLKKGYQIYFASDLHKIDLTQGRFIILNDLRGKLPYLYNVSDLAIVTGPINFFEPLTSGAKTVFFDNPKVLGRYDLDAFAKLKKAALATGGALSVRDAPELAVKLAEFIADPKPISPPYLRSADAFLNHLNDVIEDTLSQH